MYTFKVRIPNADASSRHVYEYELIKADNYEIGTTGILQFIKELEDNKLMVLFTYAPGYWAKVETVLD